MSTLHERLLEVCRDQGITSPIGRDIQAVAGLSSGRVTQIKNEREAARLGNDSLERLTGMGYSATWLQTGRPPKRLDQANLAILDPNMGSGAMLLAVADRLSRSADVESVKHPARPEPASVSPAMERIGRVPLISWVQAGDWSHAADLLHPGEAVEWIDTGVTVRPHTFALRVEGDSMEPEFAHGTILVVEPEMDAYPGDFVIAKNGDDEATFKQLVRDGADLYLKPLNARYPIKPLGHSTIVGVVREAVKRYR